MGTVWDRDRGTSEKLSQQGTKGTSPTRSGWNRLRIGFNGEERGEENGMRLSTPL